MAEDPVRERWKKAQEQVKVWKEAKSRVLAQLNSIHNLASQLETVQSCWSRAAASTGSDRSRHNPLGVVSQHPLCVELLEAKLVQAMEKAYASAMKERTVLWEVVQKLKKYTKEGQNVFTDLVGQQGIVVVCHRTPEGYSPADYLAWLSDLHSSYRADLEDKLSAMDSLKYTTESLSHVCTVWEREPTCSLEIAI